MLEVLRTERRRKKAEEEEEEADAAAVAEARAVVGNNFGAVAMNQDDNTVGEPGQPQEPVSLLNQTTYSTDDRLLGM